MSVYRTNYKTHKVIIFVPEYGQRYLTEKLIRSVIRSARHPRVDSMVVVVGDDNYKKNKEFKHGKLYIDHEPRAVEINWPTNVNFTANVNRTIAQWNPSHEDIIFIANSDIEFMKNTIPTVIDSVLETDGVIGPAVIDPHAGRHIQIVDEAMFKNEPALVKKISEFYDGELFKFPAGLSKRFNLIPATALSGCCFAMRYSTWGLLGGFDNASFKAFFEDDDFCIRAKLAGYPVAVNFNVAVKHRRGATMRREENLDQKLMPESRDKFNQKWPEITWDPTGCYAVPSDIKSNDPRVRFDYARHLQKAE